MTPDNVNNSRTGRYTIFLNDHIIELSIAVKKIYIVYLSVCIFLSSPNLMHKDESFINFSVGVNTSESPSLSDVLERTDLLIFSKKTSSERDSTILVHNVRLD